MGAGVEVVRRRGIGSLPSIQNRRAGGRGARGVGVVREGGSERVGRGFQGRGVMRGEVGRPVGPWGGLVASWATRPSGGVCCFFSFFLALFFLTFYYFPFFLFVTIYVSFINYKISS